MLSWRLVSSEETLSPHNARSVVRAPRIGDIGKRFWVGSVAVGFSPGSDVVFAKTTVHYELETPNGICASKIES